MRIKNICYSMDQDLKLKRVTYSNSHQHGSGSTNSKLQLKNLLKNCVLCFYIVQSILFITRFNGSILNINNDECQSIFSTKKKIYIVSFCNKEMLNNGRSYEDKDIEISNCFFSRSSVFSGSGGVIYVNGGSFVLNIYDSMFYNSSSTVFGGAISFNSKSSFLRMTCANRCSAQYQHFANLVALDVNEVEYLSVTLCSYTTSGYIPYRLCTANKSVTNTNNSMNCANQVSGMSFEYTSFTSIYNNYAYNNASDGICLKFDSCQGKEMFSNFIQNNSPSFGVVYVTNSASCRIENCVFAMNYKTLFNIGYGSLRVYHSFINHSWTMSVLTTVITFNNTFTMGETLQFTLYGSYFCYAELSLPKNTPFNTPVASSPIPTSLSTPEISATPITNENKSSTVTIVAGASIFGVFVASIVAIRNKLSKQQVSSQSSE